MRASILIVAFLFLGSLAAAPAVAQAAGDESLDDDRRYGQFYNGAFVDLSARGSLATSTSSPYAGWSFDAGLRQALVMHLLDTRIAYSQDEFTPRGDAVGDSFTLRSVGVWGAFHPLYMALLFSDWVGYLIASWYLEAGLAGQYGVSSRDESDWGLRLSLGTGFDVPITDPDRGWSIWLNFVYRFNWSDFDFESGDEINLHHHAGWAGLSVRFNGLLF